MNSSPVAVTIYVVYIEHNLHSYNIHVAECNKDNIVLFSANQISAVFLCQQ